MYATEKAWLASHDEKGRLDKHVAFKLGIEIGAMMHAGYVRNVGPDEPSMWDLVITQRGRNIIAKPVR